MPKTKPALKTTAAVHIRLNPALIVKLTARATKIGLPLTTWLKQLLLKATGEIK